MIIVIIIIILLALFTFPSPISSPLGFFNLARRGVTNLKIVERDMRYDYESLNEGGNYEGTKFPQFPFGDIHK